MVVIELLAVAEPVIYSPLSFSSAKLSRKVFLVGKSRSIIVTMSNDIDNAPKASSRK